MYIYAGLCFVAQSFATTWIVVCQAPLSMGILQARILERIAMPSSRGSSQPRDQAQVSRIADIFFTIWANKEIQPTFLTSCNPYFPRQPNGLL